MCRFRKERRFHVFVSSAAPLTKQPLKGSVLKYEQPLAPVAEEDWEAPADQIITATAREMDCPLATDDGKILAYAHVKLAWLR